MHTAPLSILLVENSPEVRHAFVDWLRLLGYAVLTAIDGVDALARLRAGPKPCLVLLDLQVPHSVDFRRAQMQNPHLSEIPVVVYSGLYDPHIGARQLQADGYFYSPFDLHALQRVIDVYCTKYQRPHIHSPE